MNIPDFSNPQDLQTLLSFCDPQVIQDICTNARRLFYLLVSCVLEGDAALKIEILKAIFSEAQNNKQANANRIKPSPNIRSAQKLDGIRKNHEEIGKSLESYSDLSGIADPDIRFAIELQREELERENQLSKQQEEDEKFALMLEQGSQHSNFSSKSKSSLRRGNPAEDEYERMCVVCLNGEREAIFVPCAHRCCCVNCANQIFTIKRFCPLCWMKLEGVIEGKKGPN